MTLLEAVQRYADQEHEKCEGKFLYISCGRGESEIKLTPALLNSTDWSYTFRASDELAAVCNDLFEKLKDDE